MTDNLPKNEGSASLVCAAADLNVNVGTASTGYNPALQRTPQIDTQQIRLQTTLDYVPAWKPRRIPVKCIGLTLPEGEHFLPTAKATTSSSDGTQLQSTDRANKKSSEPGGSGVPAGSPVLPAAATTGNVADGTGADHAV